MRVIGKDYTGKKNYSDIIGSAEVIQVSKEEINDKVPMRKTDQVFLKPKARIFICDIIADLYQTRHADSNGGIGRC